MLPPKPLIAQLGRLNRQRRAPTLCPSRYRIKGSDRRSSGSSRDHMRRAWIARAALDAEPPAESVCRNRPHCVRCRQPGRRPRASASSAEAPRAGLGLLDSPNRAGERVMASVSRFLTGTLKLVVNAQKSRVVKTDDCEFLGFTFRGTKLRWSERAYQDFRHRLRKLTGRSWGVSMDYRYKKLAEYVRGWMGYFAALCSN